MRARMYIYNIFLIFANVKIFYFVAYVFPLWRTLFPRAFFLGL